MKKIGIRVLVLVVVACLSISLFACASTHSHRCVKTERKEPTCILAGNIEYWKCSDCGKYFSDQAWTKEVSYSQTILDPLPHDFVDGECTYCGTVDPDYDDGSGDNSGANNNDEKYDEDATPAEEFQFELRSRDNAYAIKKFVGDSTEVIIPKIYKGKSVTWIDEDAFKGKTELTSVIIPSGITNIYYSAFEGCTALSEIVIPDSVATIWGYAFRNCTGLTEVTIGNHVTNISGSAFRGCGNLTAIVIPNSVEKIGDHAFAECDKLTNITIGNGLTEIHETAFNMTPISHASVPTTASVALKGKTTLQTLIITSGSKIIDHAFTDCTSLTSVTIGSSVTVIDEFAFYNCGLTSIAIPDSVVTIAGSAFRACASLESITIGKGVTTIGSYAFDGCNSLTDVYYRGTEDEWADIDINSSNNNKFLNATRHYNTNAD